MWSFLKGLFTIEEQKVSTLTIGFMITLGFALFDFYKLHTIDVNMCNLLIVFICTIAGVNLPNSISAVVTSVQNTKQNTTSSQNNQE